MPECVWELTEQDDTSFSYMCLVCQKEVRVAGKDSPEYYNCYESNDFEDTNGFGY